MLDEVVRGSVPPPGLYSLSGMEQARAWQRGPIPATPLARLLGYRPTQLASGSATLTMPASAWLQFSDGTVDFKILLEEALGLAVLTGAPSATRIVTSTLSVSHFRPASVESESFVARARVLNSGSAFTVAEALVEDALGRAIAHATAAFLLRAIDPPPPPHGGFAPLDEPVYATPDPHLRPVPADEFLIRGAPAETLAKLATGEVADPPLARLLDLRVREIHPGGGAVLSLPASLWFCSRWTDVNAGAIATLMHLALSASALGQATGDQYIGVVGQSLTFLRSVPADGRELIARARMTHLGGELLVSSAEVIDADGNRAAMGSQTSVVRERRRRLGTSTPARERVLATVVFTDIVGSTRRAQELGDDRWGKLLIEHSDLARGHLKTFGGREIKSTGDGFLVAFDSPARAVHWARAVRDGVRGLGLEIRAGMHTGECEKVGSDLAGIAVHAASRIESAASPGEILVSSTVHDLVAGSGIPFADRGLHELKDIEGSRQLFAVTD